MKINVLLVILLSIFLVNACKKSEVDPIEDHSGVAFSYTKLSADNDTIENGNKTKITATATGSNLTYKWDGPIGIITGAGNQVQFFACCPGDHWITCTVSDSQGNIASKTINIYALP